MNLSPQAMITFNRSLFDLYVECYIVKIHEVVSILQAFVRTYVSCRAYFETSKVEAQIILWEAVFILA